MTPQRVALASLEDLTFAGMKGVNAAKPSASVVIPAHNEHMVIGRCLDALFDGVRPGDLDVVVVCNGCSDDTATVAKLSGHPVRVIELREASKPAALRAGDVAALSFPRLYVDADVMMPGTSALRVIDRLNRGAVAARPPLRYDSARSSFPVRSYYRARSRMPAVLNSLWGAGVCGLSAAGRERFDVFPDAVADDLWLDHQFSPREVEIVDCAPVVVVVPRRAGDLIHMLRRIYRGKAENRANPGAPERERVMTSSVMADLRRIAASGLTGMLDAATYAGFAVVARLAFVGASVGPAVTATAWERDNSSRSA